MKHKKLLIALFLSIFVLMISVFIILLALGKFKNNNPIYGEFVYMNDDGSEAKVVLNDKNVYFENINYESIEEVVATYVALDELNKNNKNYEKSELDELRKKYLEQMNFESYYDKNKLPIDETLYVEEEQQFYYYLYYPNIGKNGMEISVDIKEKVLSIGDMEFQYVN